MYVLLNPQPKPDSVALPPAPPKLAIVKG
jgi:hypothetical protein